MKPTVGERAFDAAFDVVSVEQCEFCRNHDACCVELMYEVDDTGMQDFSCVNFSGPDDGPEASREPWRWDDEESRGSWRGRGLMVE